MAMRIKRGLMALGLCICCGSALISCNSKTENKADEIQEERKDVVEAQQEGDVREVRAEQAELDSARSDYKKAWNKEREDLKKELKEEVSDIEEKIAELERDMKVAGTNLKANYRTTIAELKEERTQLNGKLKDLESSTQATWKKVRADVRQAADRAEERLEKAGEKLKAAVKRGD